MKRLIFLLLCLLIATAYGPVNAQAGDNVFRQLGKDAKKAGKQAGKAGKQVGKDIGRAGKKVGTTIRDESRKLFRD